VLSESVAHGRKNIRRSRACKARNEAQKKIFSGRSGFIGDGAKRFAGPFVTLLRSRTMRPGAVEQLRGHTAYHLFKNNQRGASNQTFSCGGVSAEMAIRSASAGTSTTLGFTNQRDADFSETRRMQDRRGGDGREFLTSKRHLATMRRRGFSESGEGNIFCAHRRRFSGFIPAPCGGRNGRWGLGRLGMGMIFHGVHDRRHVLFPNPHFFHEPRKNYLTRFP
jgi:hypothetical protein